MEQQIDQLVAPAEPAEESTEPPAPLDPAVERAHTVLTGYAAAIRSVLQTKGQVPFDLPGLTIYETLSQIDASLAHCLAVQPHPLLTALHELTQRHTLWETQYLRLRRQQGWVLGLAEILDVPRTT